MNQDSDEHHKSRAIAPLTRRIIPEWTDYNRHLNVTWITHLFDLGTDNLLDTLGIGESYASREGFSTFALEAHIRYMAEAREGDDVEVHSRLIGADSKRIHYHHEMLRPASKSTLATLEQLSIHVDLTAGRSAEWPDDIRRTLDRFAQGADGITLCGAIGLRNSLPED